jgi:hypothetical protein
VGGRVRCDANCSGGARNSFLPIIRTAPGVEGPWTETLSPVLGHSDSNLACWLNGSGSLRCNGRGGGLQAATDKDWKNFSDWLSSDDIQHSASGDPLWVSSHPDDEDPMPWQDQETGVWHSIQHNLQGPHVSRWLLRMTYVFGNASPPVPFLFSVLSSETYLKR